MSYPHSLTVYRARCTNVLSADTVELLVDLGFRTYTKVLVKISGLKAPQLDAEDSVERTDAETARAHLVEWLIPFKFKNVVDLNRWPVQLRAREREEGAWEGELRTSVRDGEEFSVGERLVEMGLGIAVRG